MMDTEPAPPLLKNDSVPRPTELTTTDKVYALQERQLWHYSPLPSPAPIHKSVHLRCHRLKRPQPFPARSALSRFHHQPANEKKDDMCVGSIFAANRVTTQDNKKQNKKSGTTKNQRQTKAGVHGAPSLTRGGSSFDLLTILSRAKPA